MNNRYKFRAWDLTDRKMITELLFFAVDFPREDDIPRYDIMQWTGLLDDNDTDIYEGDILHEDGHYNGDCWVDERFVVVIFESGSFFGRATDDEYEYTELDSSGFQVVGNVYEGRK